MELVRRHAQQTHTAALINRKRHAARPPGRSTQGDVLALHALAVSARALCNHHDKEEVLEQQQLLRRVRVRAQRGLRAALPSATPSQHTRGTGSDVNDSVMCGRCRDGISAGNNATVSHEVCRHARQGPSSGQHSPTHQSARGETALRNGPRPLLRGAGRRTAAIGSAAEAGREPGQPRESDDSNQGQSTT